MNFQNIKQHVNSQAENIVKNIKYDVIGKLISIKVDCVTRLNRSILGVNVQYIIDGKLYIKTLGMPELLSRHSSDYLKEIVCTYN